MPNHLSDIDVTLEGIQSRTAHLATQLFELDGERERRAAEVDGLRGTTAAAWQRAADQIAVMWAWYQALSESVASMAARRQGRGLDPVQADALWTALTGRSVVIPPESMEVARRCLPGQTAAASTWAIDPLIGFMSDVLEGATETIASVFVVRDLGLSKVQEMAGALAAAEDKARAAGVRVSNEAAVVHDCLTALRQRLATDPLAVPVDEINQASAGVDRLGQEIDQAVAEVTGVEAALEHIQTDLQRSRANLAQARHDCADAEAKIAMPAGLPSAAAIDDLARRLAELQSNLDNAYRQFVAGDRQAAARLAGAIGPVATQVRGSTEGLARCTAAPLARRRELRGRLDAYRAKAHSLGRAEDPVVADLYQRAQEILYTAPCELDEAQRRLAAYQAYILARPQGEDSHEL